MDLLLTIVVDGLIYGAWLFIVAVGLTLIFGVLNILNIAHGSFYALGAYATASAVGLYFSYDLPAAFSLVAMFVAALGVALAVGPALERLFLRHFYGRDEVLLVLVTYALFLILEDVIKLIWGVEPYFVFQPYGLLGNVELGALFYVGYDFLVIGLAIVVGLAVWFGINRTNAGKVILAVIHDNEIARAMGVNIVRVYVVAFTIGVFLAALGGAFTSPMLSVTPGLGINVIILSFAVVIIGGLGSIGGAAIGAVFVGLSRAAAVHLLPEAELFVIYLVMALVLVFRPEGLFAKAHARKI